MSDKLIFVGTAGGRASVFRRIRRSGGFLLRLSDLWIHTDPGPGAFVYLHDMGFDPRNLDCVVLSHIHLDHSSDINSVIESATDGGKKRDLVLFAPLSALEGENRVVLPFIRRERIAKEFILEEGKEYEYKGLSIKAVMKHKHHHTETYAILYNRRILYVSCALYEDRMLEVYPKNLDLIIINTTLYEKKKYIEHLTVQDAKKILSHLKPKHAILTHFGYEVLLNYSLEDIAVEVTKETGVETICAYDGMEVEL
ncbi:MBL fold metallo-hydrolase [Thermocrinis jamiesonii]|uniref:MBL fold metallo-hydrolase n=1 Tax=Thermocrinis jamiesonii TaxID=1302351 RepID=UPI0004980134|nr:MBL fold metallo-hydrolase [Thermocrinis jamiesonii]